MASYLIFSLVVFLLVKLDQSITNTIGSNDVLLTVVYVIQFIEGIPVLL